MTTKIEDLPETIRKGQTIVVRFSGLKDEDNNLYTSFTGITFTFKIGTSKKGASGPVKISKDDDDFLKDAPNSRVEVTLTGADTASLKAGGHYTYEFDMLFNAGTESSFPLVGNVSVLDSFGD